MCGIVGYINTKSRPVTDTHSIISMLEVQRHRGPDDSGARVFNLRSGQSVEINCEEPQTVDGFFEGVLGFNRLSILDLSYNGHQPMVSPDSKVLLAMNGEVYNAFDFKNNLEKWGYHFKSTSDTEIVLALYLRYGIEGMLKRLNGMFALVIIDLDKSELLVARDRFGIKPMYYISNDAIFAFSSELKSFRYLDDFIFMLDEDQLEEYLLFRNNITGTLFKHVRQLDPGNYLTFTHNKGLVSTRYFHVNDYSRTAERSLDIESYRSKLAGWLSRSVQRQLMSDVKLGCQLSGGIDSSLVTWFANQNSSNGLFEAVSIIFKNVNFSEEKYIDLVADKLSIVAHKFPLDSTYFLEHLEKSTWHLESPINHPNTIAIYLLSQRAKEYVTVLLSGEGADEVFGGYRRYYEIVYPYLNRNFLHEIKRNFFRPKQLVAYKNYVNRAVMKTAYMPYSIAKRLLIEFNLEKATGARKLLYHSLSGSLFDRQVKYEILTYLPDLLIRQDKMSMAHSIENRVPFLDNEIVANSFTIPEKFLLLRKSAEGYNTEKYLLKKLVARYFGNEFAFREKIGLNIPTKEFFRDEKFTEYLQDKVLPGIKNRGILNSTLISDWLSRLDLLRFEEVESLWIAIAFEVWASVFLDQKHDYWRTSDAK